MHIRSPASITHIKQTDARVAKTRHKVSVGWAVRAMVLSRLGFIGQALYLTPEFFQTKPVDSPVGEVIEAPI